MNQNKAAELKWLKNLTNELVDLSVSRMRDTLPWFSEMPDSRQKAVISMAHAGIAGFINFYEDSSKEPWIAADIFGAAPRELLRLVSLQETLQLTEVVVSVVEERVANRSDSLSIATLQFSRDVAFAAADLYARAAEARGLWDARLEALVVDSIVTGESSEDLASRIAALGWTGSGDTAVLVGSADRSVDIDEIRRSIRKANCDVLIGLQGARVVLVIGRVDDENAPAEISSNDLFMNTATSLTSHFADRPLVLGPTVEQLTDAHQSARSALAGAAVCAAYRGAPRPVHADQLLPERAFAGDTLAKKVLIERIYTPLREASGDLLSTLTCYLEVGRSLEATSRALFVHTNTVRYRLKKIDELVDWDATHARDSFVLQAALAVGKIHDVNPRMPANNSLRKRLK